MKRLIYLLIFIVGCKDVYNPPLKNTGTNYLVVEGNIVAGNDSTFIHLSRTVAVSDTAGNNPEINATINVESDDGESYPLQNYFNGVYAAPPLNININKKYRLHIFTADGKEYASDYVPVKITPPIDSVSWNFNSDKGVNIYVNTHDATSNTQYYRWEFTETWKHHAYDSSYLIFDNNAIRNRLPQEQIYGCWNIVTSGAIFIASTAALSSDAVYEKKLVEIPYASQKISDIYSIIVRQYALSKEAFDFWDNLKKNTEQLGSIFDPQPFSDFGNMHCITNAGEPVLGFISACSVSQQRIFIKHIQVQWPLESFGCIDTVINDPLRFATNGFIPVSKSDPNTIHADKPDCADCRLNGGGTTVKPPYMP